jgi:hypothetical protein
MDEFLVEVVAAFAGELLHELLGFQGLWRCLLAFDAMQLLRVGFGRLLKRLSQCTHHFLKKKSFICIVSCKIQDI